MGASDRKHATVSWWAARRGGAGVCRWYSCRRTPKAASASVTVKSAVTKSSVAVGTMLSAPTPRSHSVTVAKLGPAPSMSATSSRLKYWPYDSEAGSETCAHVVDMAAAPGWLMAKDTDRTA